MPTPTPNHHSPKPSFTLSLQYLPIQTPAPNLIRTHTTALSPDLTGTPSQLNSASGPVLVPLNPLNDKPAPLVLILTPILAEPQLQWSPITTDVHQDVLIRQLTRHFYSPSLLAQEPHISQPGSGGSGTPVIPGPSEKLGFALADDVLKAPW